MVFDFRNQYQLGKATLQGGTIEADQTYINNTVQNAVISSTVPDFQAKAINSLFGFSYDLGSPYASPNFGQAIFFNDIEIDSNHLLRDTDPIVGEYYELRVGSFFGYNPQTGDPYDLRVGVYRIGFFVNLERNPVGSRVANVVATCYDGAQYRWAHSRALWTSDAIATPDGSGILRVESADIEINLLKIQREGIAFYKDYEPAILALGQDPYDFSKPILAVSFTVFQNSGQDLIVGYKGDDGDIYGAKIWFKYVRPLLAVDPDQFVGLPDV